MSSFDEATLVSGYNRPGMSQSARNSFSTIAEEGVRPDDSENSEFAVDLTDFEDEMDQRGALQRSDSSVSISFLDLLKLLVLPDYDFGSGFDQVSDSTKRKFTEMKNKTRERLRRFKSDSQTDVFKPKNKPTNKIKKSDLVSHELAHYEENLNKMLNQFDEAVQKNLQSSATEKAFYAFAVSLIAAAGFIIGKYPVYFPLFHTVIFALLMPIRFYTYFKIGFQYYLADLCYYVNVLLILFLWVFPYSKSLFVSVFALTLGTLSFAVITWRNSLVLHLIEKTTSSIIHIMPSLTMFVLVHEIPRDYAAVRYPAVADVQNWNFVNGIIVTLIYYTIWQVTYHYFITVRRKDQIAKGRVTSFTYLKKAQGKSALGKFVNSLPYQWMQVAAFTLIQFFYQILTMLPCPIWFRYKYACGAFVSFIFSWSAYNGATYYIEVFGKRFEKEVKLLRAEIDELQLRLDTQDRQEWGKPSPQGSPVIVPVSDPVQPPVKNSGLSG